MIEESPWLHAREAFGLAPGTAQASGSNNWKDLLSRTNGKHLTRCSFQPFLRSLKNDAPHPLSSCASPAVIVSLTRCRRASHPLSSCYCINRYFRTGGVQTRKQFIYPKSEDHRIEKQLPREEDQKISSLRVTSVSSSVSSLRVCADAPNRG